MEVWVTRSLSGFETFDMEGIEELEVMLKGLAVSKPLTDQEEVTVEITGSWAEIKELLSQPVFNKVWFDPSSPNFNERR